MDDVVLTPGQALAREEIINGDSPVVLITGDAGTGKDFVLTHVANEVPIKITATTGRAALNCGGSTVDSLFCFDRDTWLCRSPDRQFKNLNQTPRLIAINECSMIGHNMANCILPPARDFKKRLLLFGDFAQAYPVKDLPMFGHELFTTAKRITLRDVVRQKDPEFLQVLQDLRLGEMSDFTKNYLYRRAAFTDISIPRLYGTNAGASAWNAQCLMKLGSKGAVAQAQFLDDRPDYVRGTKPLTQAFIDTKIEDSRLAQGVRFKIASRVVCTMNHSIIRPTEIPGDEIKLVNGMTGTVTEVVLSDGSDPEDARYSDWTPPSANISAVRVIFDDYPEEVVEVKPVRREWVDANDNPEFAVVGLPLRLGYGLTVHFSQGMTLDQVAVDMASIASHPDDSRHGLFYVACSRVRRPEGLHLLSWNPRALFCAPQIRAIL